MRLVDLSHTVHDGLVTYPGIAAPRITAELTREASRARYAPGTEFFIGRIELVANTGTYLDTPFHRYADGHDLAELPLEAVAVILRARGMRSALFVSDRTHMLRVLRDELEVTMALAGCPTIDSITERALWTAT